MSNEENGTESQASDQEMMSDEQREEKDREIQEEANRLMIVKVSEWPSGMKEYVEKKTGGKATSLDMYHSVIMEYLKNKPDEEKDEQ